MTTTAATTATTIAEAIAEAMDQQRAALSAIDDQLAAALALHDQAAEAAVAATAAGDGPALSAAITGEDETLDRLRDLERQRARITKAIAALEARHSAAIEAEALAEQEGLAVAWAAAQARLMTGFDAYAEATAELWRLHEQDAEIAHARASRAGSTGGISPGRAHRRLVTSEDAPWPLGRLAMQVQHSRQLALQVPPAEGGEA